MFCPTNSQKIAKCVLLSFLSFGYIFSATIETAQRPEDDEDVGFNEDEDEDISSGESRTLHDDYFQFTTRRRYNWDDGTITTPDPTNHKATGSSSEFGNFMLQVVLPIVIPGLVISFLFFLIKRLIAKKCCSSLHNSHSPMASDRFTAVHRPPRERNRTPDARFGESNRGDSFNELERNHSTAYNTGVDISVINSTNAGSFQDGRGSNNVFSEKPPDYSTVTLNDLINPTKPAFPVVKKGNETPPPEYGKENPSFK